MSDIRPKRITYDLATIIEEFWDHNATLDTVDGTRVPHKATVRGKTSYGGKYSDIHNAIVIYEPDVPRETS